MSIPFILSTDFITVVSENKPHTVYSNDGRFTKLKEALRNKNWGIIPEIISLPKAIALFSAGKVQVFEGEVTYNGKPIHNSLTARILEFVREEFPFEPLVKFMDKLMDNPSERSREQLYNYLNLYMLPICDDGDFIAQKGVTSEFKDYHTGKIDNSVGKIIEMDRKLVNDDPNCGCHAGLHVGSEDFVSRGYSGGNVILCKINPKDVVSIPFDSSYAKMRVCRYEVIGVVGQNAAPFTSNYAPDSEVTNEIINKNEPVAQENKDDSGSVISSDRAYKIHKEGVFDLISMEYIKDSGIDELIYPSENLPRSFFRKYKDWKIEG
jgi:hypothetical protein